MQKKQYDSLESLRPHIQRGDFKVAAAMLKGQYTHQTITAQVNGHRTLKEPVFNALVKIVEARESLIENAN